MSVEERLAVDFCKLVRQCFPNSAADGPAEAEQAAELVQMFLADGKRTADQMVLTVAGFVIGTEVSQEIKDRADNLMTRLARYKNSVQETSERIQTVPVQETPQENGGKWGFYIIADLKTWADNAENRSPLEHFATFEAAKARFDELRGQDYNNEVTEPAQDGLFPARLTLGLESADGLSAIDILHVRQGRNYLVDDFTRITQLGEAPALLKILSQAAQKIGFDRIRPHEYIDDRWQAMPDIPFEEWDNPYFSSGTPGSVAARYCDFLDAYHSFPEEEQDNRSEKILQVVRFLQKEGKHGADQMSLSVAQMISTAGEISDTVRIRADSLLKELAAFNGPRTEKTVQKGQRSKSQER